MGVFVAVAVAARVRVGVAVCGRVDVDVGVREGVAVWTADTGSERFRKSPGRE
jgi:hypothetical protein